MCFPDSIFPTDIFFAGELGAYIALILENVRPSSVENSQLGPVAGRARLGVIESSVDGDSGWNRLSTGWSMLRRGLYAPA